MEDYNWQYENSPVKGHLSEDSLRIIKTINEKYAEMQTYSWYKTGMSISAFNKELKRREAMKAKRKKK